MAAYDEAVRPDLLWATNPGREGDKAPTALASDLGVTVSKLSLFDGGDAIIDQIHMAAMARTVSDPAVAVLLAYLRDFGPVSGERLSDVVHLWGNEASVDPAVLVRAGLIEANERGLALTDLAIEALDSFGIPSGNPD